MLKVLAKTLLISMSTLMAIAIAVLVIFPDIDIRNLDVQFANFKKTVFQKNKNENQLVARKISSISKDQENVVKAKPLEDLKLVPNGKYYLYKADFSCLRPGANIKDPGKALPTYKDSFEIENGVICNTGDGCTTQSKNCQTRLPSGAELSSDKAVLTFEKNIYKKQSKAYPESCQMPACAALVDICKFDGLPPLDDSGCPQGCGTITCKEKESNCPELHCSAPPQGCEYDGKAPLDSNQCPTGCGNLICDTAGAKEFKCPDLKCPKPPENCYLDSSFKVDEYGCKKTCGQIICNKTASERTVCPAQAYCPQPPAGCNYVGTPPQDQNACVVGCASISCQKPLRKDCKAPACEPPTEFCRYDGNSPLDFNGCATGCGDLVCNPN